MQMSARPRTKRLLAAASALAIVVTGVGAGTAYASTTLTSHYTGLIVKDGTTTVGEIDTTTTTNNIWSRHGSTSITGEYLSIKAPIRDRATTNGRGVYAKSNWWNNGYYCYVSGIGLGDSSGSVNQACQTDWHSDGTTSSGDYFTGSWVFITFTYPHASTMKSQNGDLYVCEDETLWTSDVCSTGPRTLGIDWN